MGVCCSSIWISVNYNKNLIAVILKLTNQKKNNSKIRMQKARGWHNFWRNPRNLQRVVLICLYQDSRVVTPVLMWKPRKSCYLQSHLSCKTWKLFSNQESHDTVNLIYTRLLTQNNMEIFLKPWLPENCYMEHQASFFHLWSVDMKWCEEQNPNNSEALVHYCRLKCFEERVSHFVEKCNAGKSVFVFQ